MTIQPSERVAAPAALDVLSLLAPAAAKNAQPFESILQHVSLERKGPSQQRAAGPPKNNQAAEPNGLAAKPDRAPPAAKSQRGREAPPARHVDRSRNDSAACEDADTDNPETCRAPEPEVVHQEQPPKESASATEESSVESDAHEVVVESAPGMPGPTDIVLLLAGEEKAAAAEEAQPIKDSISGNLPPQNTTLDVQAAVAAFTAGGDHDAQIPQSTDEAEMVQEENGSTPDSTVANVQTGEELEAALQIARPDNSPPSSEGTPATPIAAEPIQDDIAAEQLTAKREKKHDSAKEEASDATSDRPIEPTLELSSPQDANQRQTAEPSAVAPPTEAAPQVAAPPPAPGGGSAPTGSASAPQRLPPHVLGRPDAPRGHAPPIPVEAARFVQRVARAFEAARQRGGEVRLRLSPPELGSLRLQASVQDGVMVARLEMETQAARTAVVDNLPALKERLLEMGIRVERFDVDLMQQQPSGTPDRPSDWQQRDEVVPLGLQRPAATQATESQPSTLTPMSWNGPGGLNVIV